MSVLSKAIPDPEVLLAMEPEELGGVILHNIDAFLQNDMFHRQSVEYFDSPSAHVERHPKQSLAVQAISEAIQWLEIAGLLVPAPGANGSNGWRQLTRRGQRLKASGNALNYKAGALLPREMLHPTLNEECWPLFIKGQHDLAVFAAFKSVEVAVRAAAGLPDTLIGVELMRAAFNEKGMLADKEAQLSEIKALENMIAGAFGCIRNPVGHRQIGLDESKGSAEMIVMASYFLRITSERRAKLLAARAKRPAI